MHWQQKEQNFKRTRPENNSNAVMVRGRQLEELAPALLLPLFSSLTTFLFSTTTIKNLASRIIFKSLSIMTKEEEDSLLLLLLPLLLILPFSFSTSTLLMLLLQ
jgi:hypothetical protein